MSTLTLSPTSSFPSSPSFTARLLSLDLSPNVLASLPAQRQLLLQTQTLTSLDDEQHIETRHRKPHLQHRYVLPNDEEEEEQDEVHHILATDMSTPISPLSSLSPPHSTISASSASDVSSSSSSSGTATLCNNCTCCHSARRLTHTLNTWKQKIIHTSSLISLYHTATQSLHSYQQQLHVLQSTYNTVQEQHTQQATQLQQLTKQLSAAEITVAAQASHLSQLKAAQQQWLQEKALQQEKYRIKPDVERINEQLMRKNEMLRDNLHALKKQQQHREEQQQERGEWETSSVIVKDSDNAQTTTTTQASLSSWSSSLLKSDHDPSLHMKAESADSTSSSSSPLNRLVIAPQPFDIRRSLALAEAALKHLQAECDKKDLVIQKLRQANKRDNKTQGTRSSARTRTRSAIDGVNLSPTIPGRRRSSRLVGERSPKRRKITAASSSVDDLDAFADDVLQALRAQEHKNEEAAAARAAHQPGHDDVKDKQDLALGELEIVEEDATVTQARQQAINAELGKKKRGRPRKDNSQTPVKQDQLSATADKETSKKKEEKKKQPSPKPVATTPVSETSVTLSPASSPVVPSLSTSTATPVATANIVFAAAIQSPRSLSIVPSSPASIARMHLGDVHLEVSLPSEINPRRSHASQTIHKQFKTLWHSAAQTLTDSNDSDIWTRISHVICPCACIASISVAPSRPLLSPFCKLASTIECAWCSGNASSLNSAPSCCYKDVLSMKEMLTILLDDINNKQQQWLTEDEQPLTSHIMLYVQLIQRLDTIQQQSWQKLQPSSQQQEATTTTNTSVALITASSSSGTQVSQPLSTAFCYAMVQHLIRTPAALSSSSPLVLILLHTARRIGRMDIIHLLISHVFLNCQLSLPLFEHIASAWPSILLPSGRDQGDLYARTMRVILASLLAVTENAATTYPALTGLLCADLSTIAAVGAHFLQQRLLTDLSLHLTATHITEQQQLITLYRTLVSAFHLLCLMFGFPLSYTLLNKHVISALATLPPENMMLALQMMECVIQVGMRQCRQIKAEQKKSKTQKKVLDMNQTELAAKKQQDTEWKQIKTAMSALVHCVLHLLTDSKAPLLAKATAADILLTCLASDSMVCTTTLIPKATIVEQRTQVWTWMQQLTARERELVSREESSVAATSMNGFVLLSVLRQHLHASDSTSLWSSSSPHSSTV